MYYKFGFRPHLTGLGPVLSRIRKRIGGAKVNIPIEAPQQVMLSALYAVTSKFSLMGNVGWQNWSAFGEFPVGSPRLNRVPSPTPICIFQTRVRSQSGNNSGSVKNGSGRQDLYDSSPVSKANRIPTLPLDRQLRYGTGIQYQIIRDVTVGGAWEFMDAAPRPTVLPGPLAGTLQGHYSTNYLNFVALNVIWKF